MPEFIEESEGRLAAALVERSALSGSLICLARSETRAVRLVRAAQALAPELPIRFLPSWDCLPYDTTSPSHHVMGLRMEALRSFAERDAAPRLLIAPMNAAMQRLPPTSAYRELPLRVGEGIETASVERELRCLGYAFEDRVDEPGEAALRGLVLETLEAFDRVGAGFAISARDMDLRGAGDLLGESQAGHVKLIGLDLYQYLLDRTFRAGRGETIAEEWAPS